MDWPLAGGPSMAESPAVTTAATDPRAAARLVTVLRRGPALRPRAFAAVDWLRARTRSNITNSLPRVSVDGDAQERRRVVGRSPRVRPITS
ncbi:MAG TPA: hypothetical protein VFI46_11080 [Jiangellaceae bacterium]|nr:hypothetical protein [Jiangellaceae bacterium]